uniref:Uncharacterized protein n=1 Tax=Mycena chlorophos TaxID=658473 RepID=A0ABQ0KW25_MYCCL|nr:predicted protein [Mycena chlorophos]
MGSLDEIVYGFSKADNETMKRPILAYATGSHLLASPHACEIDTYEEDLRLEVADTRQIYRLRPGECRLRSRSSLYLRQRHRYLSKDTNAPSVAKELHDQ